jgi:dTDP-glucose pyrophosphorylase
MRNVAELCIGPGSTLRDVLVRSNACRRGIVLVVDEHARLVGVITDGDIRRAILAGLDLATPTDRLLARKGLPTMPITAPESSTHDELVALIRRTGVSHIPVVNAAGQVVRLVGLDDLLDEDELALKAVVMAGGKGSRLHPLTEDLPKPMLPLGDRPLMERIIRQLSEIGVRNVAVTTHYLQDKIVEHFGDGERFGVHLDYVAETTQRGTAGGLAQLDPPDTPLLVINGDILTELDFRAMLNFHREHDAALTAAVRPYEVNVPYGVVEVEGEQVRRVVEKPTYRYFVNAGIYLIEPRAHRMIPAEGKFDMTDLMGTVLAAGLRVVSFPVWEYWRDIGHHDDYLEAQADLRAGKVGR